MTTLGLIFASLQRQPRRKAMSFAAVALAASGATVASSLLVGAGDRLTSSLQSYGANLLISPSDPARPMQAGSIGSLASGFWKNNLQAASPELQGLCGSNAGRIRILGVRFSGSLLRPGSAPPIPLSFASLHPWMRPAVRWPSDAPDGAGFEGIWAGRNPPRDATTLAIGLSPQIEIRIVGSAEGDSADPYLIVPLAAAQKALGRTGEIDRVWIRALTTPEYGLLETLHRDPRMLPKEQYEKWSCTSYPSTVAASLESGWPGARVTVQRSVTDAEGRFLDRATWLLGLLAGLGLLGAAMAVFSTVSHGVREERPWIALMRVLGATRAELLTLYGGQILVIALAGAVLGVSVGSGLAAALSQGSKHFPLSISPSSLALAALAALATALAGAAFPIVTALRVQPAPALHEQAAA